jgi:hypothetical protein
MSPANLAPPAPESEAERAGIAAHRRISPGILALVPEWERENGSGSKLPGDSEGADLQALLRGVDDRIRTGDRLDHKMRS